MRATSTTNRFSPIVSFEERIEIEGVVRVVLNEQRRRSQPSCGIAVISVNREAGTTSISKAIAACVNKLAMEREASRMAADIAETVSSSQVYGERSRMMAGIQEVVTKTAICTDPSRLAITLDYRKLSQPGAAFGAVVAGTLSPELLRGQTNAGQSVKDVLDGLPIEWDSMLHCRKECLSLIAELFRLIVIDMPSREESPGLQEVASLVDGVIIVVEENRTTRNDLTRLTKEIEASGGRVIGNVLNKHRDAVPNFLLKRFEKGGWIE